MGSSDGAVYYETAIKGAWITDLELSYRIGNAWTMSVGANNLFNKYPDMVNSALLAEQRANLDNSAVGIYPAFSPFGINGAYYYAKAGLKF
jgi:iron complex outermembrane receptor protein